eukprot:TRINITY_DN8594_c0_g1_i5.p1 TRINITY_DN8594_c0_g1~~TRINITY_DN8594_c0_g1_i5.p1  ORF type:complete len:321 (+),score=25.55 TRINITY_DN8594_c0_g1_i5:209-1171(+)
MHDTHDYSCQGKLYMALQDASQCWCGDTYRTGDSKHFQVADNDCGLGPTGGCPVLYGCGGPNRNSIWQIAQVTCAKGNYCNSGWVAKSSWSTKINPSNAKCCEATCAAGNYCNIGWVAKSSWSTKIKPSNAECCETTTTTTQAPTSYSLHVTGACAWPMIWEDERGLSVQECYDLIMQDSRCAKDYFTFVARLATSRCACKRPGTLKLVRAPICLASDSYAIAITTTTTTTTQAPPSYSLHATGACAWPMIWEDERGLSVQECYDLIMQDSRCAKDYFTFVARGAKSRCACKRPGTLKLVRAPICLASDSYAIATTTATT